MSKIVLPPKYYLSHFFEFLEFIETHYFTILEDQHLRFISDFNSLSEDAQCAYIRMINRKGSIFDRNKFQKYMEIEDIEKALAELWQKGFIGDLSNSDTLDLLSFLPKPSLVKWLSSHNISFSKTISRDEIVDLGRENLAHLDFKVNDISSLMVQRRTEAIEYLLFLYFGRIQKSLTLYTLRDLGIRQSATLKNKFKPRFVTKQQAEAEYFFAKKLEEDFNYYSSSQLNALFIEIKTYQNLLGTTQNLKDELLSIIADFSVEENIELALAAWSECRNSHVREKMARQLYKMDRKEPCLKILEEILADPRSDEELLFAEDFMGRKFHKKKIGLLSEILNNSHQINLSDYYLKRPEYGVVRYFEKQGHRAWFTENTLWTSLFGVLFWEELFESEEAAIHNPFERSPADLVGPDFYQRHAVAIESKLELFKDKNQLIKKILQNIVENFGRLNDVFQWHMELSPTLVEFINNLSNQNVAIILKAMAKNFEINHTGFPDLMVMKDAGIRFIEVKAEGDALRTNQLGKMRLLREAGFEVEVLKVQWQTDPHQVYIVVDVETTGGSANFHRVTEIGAVKIQDGKVIDEFQTLINPGRPIPPFITQITGITNEMVADAPAFSDIADKFLEFMEEGLFVAHNVKFDYGFIQREFARCEIEFVRPQLCTCAGMRKAYPGISSYGLKNLTAHFNINLVQHHRALSDARAAAELLILMNEKRQAYPIDSIDEPATAKIF